MSIFDNIRSVSKYESKLLMRSWFYRIFLVLAVVSLCIFNFAALIGEDGFWMMKAVASNIPYVNLLFLNTGQAVIAVFLSSEFLKSDKKLDTSEVFYVHPLSNAEYVAGKIWGNMKVFFRLDLFIIIIVAVFNLASGITFDWAAYITYFFLICIPTLIYIFGLSVGLMLILKNQAITFVLLLGYIALTLFYIEDKFYYLFDYMVYSLPLMKSSIVGFTNWATLINHRCIYLLIGLGFICISIFLFRRLPNTKYGRYRWLALAVCFLTAAGFAGYNHVSPILKEAEVRTLYTDINNKYVHKPKMVIDNYDITVEQHPETISVEVVMKGVALEASPVFVFCLNPALQVREIKEGEKELSFNRESQIILVDFGREIARGDSVSFRMKYDGRIDGGFCYLDIPEEILQQQYSSNMFRIDKKYSFQSNNYILFTPETYWYPCPGTSYSSDSPDWQQAYFSNFRLTVKTLNGLKALSQGTMKWPPVKKSEKRERRKPGIEEPPKPNEERAMVNGERRTERANPGQEARSEGQASRRGAGAGAGADRRQGGGQMQGTPPQGQGRNFERGAGRNPEQGARRGEQGTGNPERGAGNEGQGAERGTGGVSDRNRFRNVERDSAQAPGINFERGAGRNPEQGARRGERGMGNPERGAGNEGQGFRRGADGVSDRNRNRFRDADSVAQGIESGRKPDTDSTASDGASENNLQKDLAEKPADTAKDSLFIFETDFPTPSITLIIGDYEQKSIDVDDVVFSVCYLKGHDYFSSV
ncbi:MAG: xanthan lyase, partial [Tannerella sp.]|nr:xanthan lyase [Tannerella sp.]